jgi:hypothetical protein
VRLFSLAQKFLSFGNQTQLGGGGPEEEEEEDLFVFSDTIQGPRAPAVKPGRITQLKLETPGAQAYCSTYYKAVRVGDSWLLLNTLNFELLNF